MVWFQCEDCGDNLKKPKLPGHFRVCSAFKLSCIDCGEVFGKHNVEGHTQCITEAEKYGPKGQSKASNGVNKPKNDAKQKPEVDINVGLSERPPWFCSLCNTKATSKQTLLLHADGKKHRAKARAFHAANQKPDDITETKSSTENNAGKDETTDLGKSIDQNLSQVATVPNNNDSSELNKKRKVDAYEKDGSENRTGGNNLEEIGNGDACHVNGVELEVTKSSKKAKHIKTKDAKLDSVPDEDVGEKKIKWKKLISSALKSNADGTLKLKELKKLVIRSLKESGYSEDKNQVYETIQQKINSSSKFVVNGKYVSLATGS